MHAHGGGFQRRSAGAAFGQVGIKGGRFGQRHWKHGLQAVDDIGRKDERDLQPRLLHRHALQFSCAGGAHTIEEAGDAALCNLLQQFGPALLGSGRVGGSGFSACGVGIQAELAGFFFQRHAGDERFDLGF